MTHRLYQWAVRIFTLHPFILYLLVYILFAIKAAYYLDPDFGWHLSSGQYILTHGVPHHDIYSYSMPSFPWIHHEWLADVGNYLIYHYGGGYITLALLYAGLWTLAIRLVVGRPKQRLLVMFAAVLLLPFAGVRAITWSLVFSAVIIRLCQSTGRARWFIPLVMLAWANMHGSFVVGIAYLIWQSIVTPSRAMIGTVLLSLIATCITPYGSGMYIEVFRTMTDTTLHTNIAEWQPLQLGMGEGMFTGIWVAMITLEKASWRKKSIRFETLLLIMAISSVRQMPLFILFALPTVLNGVKKLPRPVLTVQTKRLFIVTLILLLSAGSLLVLSEFVTLSPNREAPYPQTIAAKLRSTPCSGHVFAGYDYGGYLIWKVPGEKLFIDGRMPSWSLNGDDIMADYVKITKDTTFRDKEFVKFDIRCVVWDSRTAFTHQLQQTGWRIVSTEPRNHLVLLKK